MIKAIVVANTYSQFATYIRNRNLNRNEYGYYVTGKPEKCIGLNREKTKVLWLEGWSMNDRMESKDVDFLKNQFENHQQVPEGFIYGQNFSF